MAEKSIKLATLRAHHEAQVPPRLGLRIVAVVLLLELLVMAILVLGFVGVARAAPLKAEVNTATDNGFARLVFAFPEETDATVRLSNGILVISFARPIDVNVDRIPLGLKEYVSAARRDPDGTAVRLALIRKVTINSMAAGEKFFVDLLPEGWAGLPPGLPREVIEELAKRARDAEKRARQQRQATLHRDLPPIRVRVGTQPTFTRYVFELPELVPISTDRAKDQLTLTFEAPLKFDLADAQAALPPMLGAIEAMSSQDSIAVRFEFIGKVDVRTFREDNNYVVDVLAVTDRTEPVAQLQAAAEQRRGPPAAAAAPSAIGPPPEQVGRPPPATARAAPPAAAASEPARQSEQPAAPAGVAASEPPAGPSAPAAPAPAREAGDAPTAQRRDPNGQVVVDMRRQGDALRITFPFAQPTPSAVFRRGDTLWLVFDSAQPIDVTDMVAKSARVIRTASVTKSRGGQVVHLKLDRPQLTSIEADGANWTVILGDMMLEPTKPLGIVRTVGGGGRVSAAIAFDQPQQLHRISDPEIGDMIMVVTALAPARGFIKTQDYVEFRALASTHGVAIQPLADDLNAEIGSDKIVLTRTAGLTMSDTRTPSNGKSGADPLSDAPRDTNYRPFVFDTQLWGFDREADYRERQGQLVRAAAEAPEARRPAAWLELARFYLARNMPQEAKGVLDLAVSAGKANREDPATLVLRAVSNIMMRRGGEALKDLAHPAVGNQHDAPMWRALAYAQQGKWIEARVGFKTIETALPTLPVELQRIAYKDAMRAAIEVKDFGDAVRLLQELETIGVPRDLQPAYRVLKGRVAEGIGRAADAETSYRAAADSWDRAAAAQGRLRSIVLRHSLGEIKSEEAIAGLENITTTWRGDETEVEALQLLARLYTEEGRYRDAFHVMRTALAAHPNSEMTRRIHDEAAATFDALFLGGQGDTLPAIDALTLFYDYKELTPVGRRGDEMIRRLAERLVSVDLLDQAAELLQHQVDHRLQGAARAQVAIRLSVVYLMARKPDRTIQVLRETRTGDLPNEVRNQRLLIEGRALSDTGRHDVALEVIANVPGREAERLRADILWSARRWRLAAEQIEKYFGERWRDFSALTVTERADLLRAGIGYTLAEDKLGLDRFRQKYGPVMAESPDARAFDTVTMAAPSSTEFIEIAKSIAATDTLDNFLRDINARFPDSSATSTVPANGTRPASQAPSPRRPSAGGPPVPANGTRIPAG